MILIGERINGMFKNVKEAITQKDKKVIQELAKKQTEAGASYLDVNVGTAAADQEGTIQWLVETIQETCSTPLSLDSQKPNVIAAGLKVINAENGVILNSTPLNKKSDEEILDKYIEMANPAAHRSDHFAGQSAECPGSARQHFICDGPDTTSCRTGADYDDRLVEPFPGNDRKKPYKPYIPRHGNLPRPGFGDCRCSRPGPDECGGHC